MSPSSAKQKSRSRGVEDVTISSPLPFPHTLILLTIVLSLLALQAAQAQQVRTYLSADSVSVGERFTLSLVVRHRFTSTALFPAPDAGSDVFGDLDVLARGESHKRYLGRDDPGARIDSVAYEVTTFALDSARVPALPVRLATAQDTSTATSPPRIIPVRSVVPSDAKGVRDLAPPASFPAPRWPWILLMAAALVMAGLAYYWWTRRESEQPAPAPEPAPKPSVSPYTVATRRLQRLQQATDLDDASSIKSFYVELSDLLRTYLAHRLHIAALERTTPELVELLHQRPDVPAQAVNRIESALEQADLAKFADAHPPPETSQAALDDTRATLDTIEDALRPPEPVPPRPASAPVDSRNR